MISTLYNPGQYPAALQPFTNGSDDVEVKTVVSDRELPQFLAGVFLTVPDGCCFCSGSGESWSR